ncbi:polysaccharide deacetylase family protein [Peribacillus butanolivorans]|uniref:polysaccharide deacetylase family protein n=1 Tax=Peribacillus butanolivorans TaxID=421767 RepID=UPI00167F2896|nr:polysaccharide deacetylase family protein [Peribacillus butanolivorans]QNU03865.1 polysaccharide deacetylase family protein [Peribacillus butanolivorans]
MFFFYENRNGLVAQLAEEAIKSCHALYSPTIPVGKVSLQKRKPLFTIIDDDASTHTQSILYTIAGELGFKFGSCVILDRPQNNTPVFLNWDQLRTLQSDGHEILSHTMTHAHLGLIPESQLDYELGTSRDILLQQGFVARHFVYPGGSYVKNNACEKTDTSVLNKVRNYYDSAWVINESINKGELFNNYKGLLIGFDALGTLGSAKAAVDQIFANGGWLVLMMHVFQPQWATPKNRKNYGI